MGGTSMFKNRRVMRWAMAGAAALSGVLLWSCVGDKDVDAPMRVRDAVEVPLNFSMDMRSLVEDMMFDSVLAAIDSAEREDDPGGPKKSRYASDMSDSLGQIIDSAKKSTLLSDEDKNTLATIITDDKIIRNFIAGNIDMNESEIRDYVDSVMKNDTAVDRIRKEVGWNDAKVERIAQNTANKVTVFKEDAHVKLKKPMGLPMNPIDPQLDSAALKLMDKPSVVRHKIDLLNESPIKFSVYALFYEQFRKTAVDGMNDSIFLDFIERGKYTGSSGFVNPFESATAYGLRIESGEPADMPPESKGMNNLLGEWVKGNTPLLSRWVILIEDEADKTLKILTNDDIYSISVKLSVKLEFTLDLDSLFNM